LTPLKQLIFKNGGSEKSYENAIDELIICAELILMVLIAPAIAPERNKTQELPVRLTMLVLENTKAPVLLPKADVSSKAVQKDPQVQPSSKPKSTQKCALNKEARVPMPNKAPVEINVARRWRYRSRQRVM
jgi:hypothetical protein